MTWTSSKPPLVCLHGLFSSPADWEGCASHLSSAWEIYMPDMPILNGTRSASSVEGLAAGVHRQLDALGLGRVILVGNSLGGHVALLLAIEFPDRIAGLVLTGSSGLFERGQNHNIPRRSPSAWIRARIGEVFHDQRYVTEALIEEVGDAIADPKKLRSMVRLAGSAKRDNLRSKLHRVQCPVTLIWGSNDRITPPEVAAEFQAHLPDVDLHFIPNCGHAPMIEHPAEFARLLEAALARRFHDRAVLEAIT